MTQKIVVIAVVAAIVIGSAVVAVAITANNNNKDNSDEELVLKVGVVQSGFNGIPSVGRVKYNTSQEFLFTNDANGKFVPQLADSWTTEDNKTWIFNLNHDAKWHDGVAFTAKDVKYSMDYAIENPSGDTRFLSEVAENGVTIVDNHTVKVVLKSADSMFLWNLRIGFRINPEHIYKDYDNKTINDLSDDPKSMIGTGPLKFVSANKDAGTLTFEAFPDYYRGQVAVDKVIFKYYANMDVEMLALKTGEIDTVFERTGIPYYYAANLLRSDDLDIKTYESMAVNTLLFNDSKDTFSDLRLREAIKYALNYDQIVNICVGGWGTVGTEGIVPSSLPYYLETTKLKQDIALAKEKLAAAGYVDTDNDGFVEKPDGTAWQPKLLVSDSDPYLRTAEVIKQNLNKVGIDVNVYTNTTNGRVWRAEFLAGEHDMIIGWTAPIGTFGAAGYATTLFDANTGATPYGFIDNVEFDTLVANMHAAVTEAQIEAAAHAIQKYYADHISGVELYNADILQPYNKHFTGYSFDPFYGVLCYDTYYNLALSS